VKASLKDEKGSKEIAMKQNDALGKSSISDQAQHEKYIKAALVPFLLS
jgi:hypothetical protein